ncbi:MAG: serine/threonine protein kinase [Anaerolineaceae bacterium]|nr:serine/threonine protein kinase [Anaerolineaceae bacterium]
MVDLIGKQIDRYQIVAQLGEGGMATVYKALDTRLERYVALKVITTNLQSSQQFLQRFEREAKALAKLSHPNIVDVHDYGEENGRPYLVMEFIDGGHLKSRMGSPHAFQEAAKLLIPIASALGYAHQRDIIHRDVKPANILMQRNGTPMLSDFGIAKVLETNQPQLTRVGVGIGTPEYMAPEQGQGNQIDHRADIYSLGLVFYELVTGRKPFQADTPMAIVWKQVTEPLPDPRKFVPSLPPAVVTVLQKALQKKPGDRYQSMKEFEKAFEKLIAIGNKLDPATEKYKRTSPPVPPDQQQKWTQSMPANSIPSASQQQFNSPPIQPPVSQSLPRVAPPEKKKNKGCWIWIVAGTAITLIIVCGIIAIVLGLPDDFLGLSSTNTPTPTVTPFPTNTPTSTPEPTMTATWTPVPTNTQIADIDQEAGTEWETCLNEITPPTFYGMPVTYCDNFNSNNGWYLEQSENDRKIHNRYLSGNVLYWDITSKQGVMTYEPIPVHYSFTTFAVQMKFKRFTGPDNSDAGLVFRMDYDAGDYYFVTVSDVTQKYAFYLKYSDSWTTLKEWTYSSLIIPDDWNSIGIYADGSTFDLYINDIYVESFYDSTLTEGEVGIGGELYAAGDFITFGFDSIIVLEP